MKKYINFIFVITLLLSVLTACDREKIDYGLDGDNSVIQGEGKVNFEFSLDVVLTKAADVALGDYIITLFDSEQNQIESCTYSEFPESMELKVGSYTIEAKSHADFDMSQACNYPYYVASKGFEIKKGETTTIDKLVCTMQNIKVEMIVDTSLEEILDSYEVTATFKAGETSLSFSYDQNNTGEPFTFFPAINESNVLIVQLTGMSGSKKIDMGKTYTAVEAGDYRRITFIYSENIAGGSADINLNIDAVCEVVNKNIIVPGIDNNGGGTDPGTDPNPGTIEITGASHNGTPFDIDEAQFIPAAGDTEIVVNIKATKGIKNLFVTIDSTVLNTVLAGSGLDEEFDLVNPGELELALGKGTEEDPGFGFPIKEEIYGEESLDFSITPFTGLLGLFGESNNKFILRVVDLDGKEIKKTLTIVVQ